MSNLFTDLGSVSNNDFLSSLGDTGFGDILSNTITKNIVPRPAAAQPAQAPSFTPVSVSKVGKNKMIYVVGGAIALLTLVYFVKKRRK
jgi:hypothetical protein